MSTVFSAIDRPPDSAMTVEGESFTSLAPRIEYLKLQVPEPGHFTTIVPGILWLRLPLPMELNHINLWLLEDHDGWTLIDSGLNAELCKESWLSLEAKLFAARPLKRIFVTHLHPDHIGLARWLQERHGASVWMSARGSALARRLATEPTPEELARAEDFARQHGYRDSVTATTFFSGKLYRSRISGVPTITHAPCDEDVIEIGGEHWRSYETNGHAEGHQCLHNSERGILISGDQVLPTISSNVSYAPRGSDKNPLDSYLTSLERLSRLDERTLVLPSHGRPFYGLRARAADLIAHHREHLAALQAACTEARTAFELIPVLFKRRLIGMHWMFAMGETIAHAEYLVHAGTLTRAVSRDGMIRYVAK